MDGFDDLLTPSQSSLENNPFADPFAPRSSSPDPWTSPFARQASSDVFEYQERATTPPLQDEPETPAVDTNALLDPLDTAAHTEDDPDPLASHSPGFRESVPESEPGFSEIATIRPTEPEELQSSIPVPEDEPTTPARTLTPTPATPPPRALSESAPSLPHVPPSPSRDWGPLDGHAALTRSFPNLALGAETQADWGEQENWSNDRTPPTRLPTEEDSDDDKPVLQTVRQPPPDRQNTIKPGRDGLPPMFVISVDDPQKVGDPIRSFTMYTVHTRTTSPLFQKSAFSVLRRYSDFLWLYETLSNNNPGVVVPPVPEKNPFGRFDDQFVRQRRFALEKCIHKIANHPVLGKDPDLKLFLESDTFSLDIKHRKAEIAQQSGGLMATIGQSLAGPRFYETDEWFDRQKAYLDSLEAQLRGLVKAIELVSKQRGELATAMAEFATNVTDLSQSDVGKQLAHSLAGLADVEHKAQDIQSVQSEQDIVTLLSTVDEYARLINSVRLAFNSRIRTYHSWRAADADLLRVKQTHERNRVQGRATDRAGHSLSQIADSERRALDAKHEFDQATKLIKTEVARFEQERIEDFKDSLHAFLEGMIGRQKEIIAGWENYQQMLLKRVGGGRGLPGQQPVPVS
ncbi:Vps5 C terminal like-domain-containing protein [Mycena albidolilacea]|uniref:Vps5 C terminal like-domain-containing protein n=1 Tax=Mycena albidolilacea TaxID=1033008 RepID=A0AAD7EKZ9_9AGAR|nr:Vps5 C terminal like-domain-containing protein [Mycena albidolilacea]